jgi:hypothetical protein
MGWPIRRIADEAGLDFETLSRARRSVRVQLRTHELIAAAYERLEHIDFGDTRTKKWAQQQGFTHPAYWDDIDDYFEIPAVPADSGAVDEIVVRRLVNGQPVPGATQAERLEAVRILTLRGRSADEIAAALRVSGRTVERDRKALAC